MPAGNQPLPVVVGCASGGSRVHAYGPGGGPVNKYELIEELLATAVFLLRGVEGDPDTELYAGKAVESVESAMGWAKVLTAFRSEEHTSELQSRENLVCRLLLEKKNLIIA